MENRSQGKISDDDVIGQQNNKRPSMLSVSGLWDVVPRLDHYRYIHVYKIIELLNTLYNQY